MPINVFLYINYTCTEFSHCKLSRTLYFRHDERNLPGRIAHIETLCEICDSQHVLVFLGISVFISLCYRPEEPSKPVVEEKVCQVCSFLNLIEKEFNSLTIKIMVFSLLVYNSNFFDLTGYQCVRR